ncbi:hypothetical protein EMIHUDRAFT_235983 [Emiliania huxleyi CCMP1516]|uniref:Uncharacterized protein n=2 Tax=Emiliania huxleyi TaxID=2903 RepID=A0A0D3JV32_EMIH1|nr:hypothetical protein EMIHUDRAFT_235983 [Emiliania huxleyi CCMP1516]EOD27367.1 hypothetical protein EMIHUDRAFT_235983 [Emiliania huxleyi CCMP1516]|eukprot:XP_005779796.1 hypothetical protein EMIHUDRAFT_235983 [Emiliania huxleyi CCMP1516]
MTKLRIEGNPIEDKGERVIYEAVRDKEDFLLGTDGMGEQFETSSETKRNMKRIEGQNSLKLV